MTRLPRYRLDESYSVLDDDADWVESHTVAALERKYDKLEKLYEKLLKFSRDRDGYDGKGLRNG